MNKLYHIVLNEDWLKFKEEDIYYSSTFESEKFIHLSTKNQIEGTLNNYYSNFESVLLLVIDSDKIAINILFEASPSGEKFPHLYSGLSKNVILNVLELRQTNQKWDLSSLNN